MWNTSSFLFLLNSILLEGTNICGHFVVCLFNCLCIHFYMGGILRYILYICVYVYIICIYIYICTYYIYTNMYVFVNIHVHFKPKWDCLDIQMISDLGWFDSGFLWCKCDMLLVGTMFRILI